MKAVWLILLVAACDPRLWSSLDKPSPSAQFWPPPATLRVPEDADTIAEAIAAGGSIIQVGVGEFDLTRLPLATTRLYTIRGSGIDRTKLRTDSSTPFPEKQQLTLRDLTLEEAGSRFISYTSGSLDFHRVHLIGELRTNSTAVRIQDSSVEGRIDATGGSLSIMRSAVTAGPLVRAAVEASASEGVTLEVRIRDTVLEATRIGLDIRETSGTVNATLGRVAVTSSEIGASLVCMGRGRINVTLDHSVFYNNRSAAVLAKLSDEKTVGRCGRLEIHNSIFVQNRGVAVELHGHDIVATHNFSWRNAGGNYKNWTPQDPFIEVNPMFVDPARKDFRVPADSPAVTAGVGVADRGVRPDQIARELDSPFKAAGPVPAGRPAVKGGRKLALVVGVQDYQDPAIKDLKYARKDAEAVAQYLSKAGYTVNLLIEGMASMAAVKVALISLTQANLDDSVFIYFSVHGSGESNPLGAGRGFLLMSDARASSIPATALPVQDIQTAIDHTESDRVVLVIDACFSGGASDRAKSIWVASDTKGEGGDGASITGPIVYGRGKLGLFSSRDNEVSLEADEFKHGYFTYYLLRAWDLGLRSLDEVYAYVLREVVSNTKGQQHPRYSSARAEGQAPTF